MKTTFLISITALLLLGCSSDSSLNTEIDAIKPECLQQIIIGILDREPTNPRATIRKFLYKDNEVFVIDVLSSPSDRGADAESFVRDSSCNLICLLGGIDGQPSSECSDFNQTAQFIETIWTDPR